MKTATTDIQQIGLSKLVPSPQNARKRHDRAGIESLAASIQAHGLIYPLIVRPNGKAGNFQVEEGGRRLAALQLLQQRGDVEKDFSVACIELERGALASDQTASEIGLAANVLRADLHPAEEVAAFAKLQKAGQSPAEIATRFGIPERRVKQRLALGDVSPTILEAWLDNKIDARAVEAFTLANSRKEQEMVYKRLTERGSHGLSAWNVKHAFGLQNNGDIGRLFVFVGREAYEAAGGKVVEDLFGEDSRVSDPELVKRLAGEKLLAEAAKLDDAGWSWATPEHMLDGYQSWSWGSVQATRRNPTKAEKARIAELRKIAEWGAEEDEVDDARADEIENAEAEIMAIEAGLASFDDNAKKRAGCVVSVGRGGGLEIRYGVIRPKPGKTSSRSTPKATDPVTGKKREPAPVSNALLHRVSTWATEAARAALVEEPRLGLAALIAGTRTVDYASPIKLRLGDRVWNAHAVYDEKRAGTQRFATELKKLLALSDAALMKEAAIAAATALDLQIINGERKGPLAEHATALADSIDGKRLNKALRDRFDAADYFKSVSSTVLKKAISEATGEKVGGNAKKGELVDLAVKKIPATGWLPGELRTAHYDGPGASTRAKAKKPTKPTSTSGKHATARPQVKRKVRK